MLFVVKIHNMSLGCMLPVESWDHGIAEIKKLALDDGFILSNDDEELVYETANTSTILILIIIILIR